MKNEDLKYYETEKELIEAKIERYELVCDKLGINPDCEQYRMWINERYFYNKIITAIKSNEN